LEGGVFFRETGLFEEEDIFSRQAAKPPREESFCSSCFAIRAKALRPGGPIVF